MQRNREKTRIKCGLSFKKNGGKRKEITWENHKKKTPKTLWSKKASGCLLINPRPSQILKAKSGNGRHREEISIYREETNSWTWRTDLKLPRGRAKEGDGLGVWG